MRGKKSLVASRKRVIALRDFCAKAKKLTSHTESPKKTNLQYGALSRSGHFEGRRSTPEDAKSRLPETGAILLRLRNTPVNTPDVQLVLPSRTLNTLLELSNAVSPRSAPNRESARISLVLVEHSPHQHSPFVLLELSTPRTPSRTLTRG